MTSKRRRKRRTPRSGSGAPATRSSKTSAEPLAPEEAPAERRPTGFGLPSPHPPLGASLLRGVRAVGGSPVLLGTAFLCMLLTWGVFVALGSPPRPRELALLMSLPPTYVLADVPASLGAATDTVGGLAAIAALAATRAVTFGLLIRLLVDGLGDRRVSLPEALRGLPRSILPLAVVYLVGFGLTLLGSQVIASFLGQLAIFTIVVALYLLAFAPVVVVSEGARPQDALRRSFRAARLPGTRHLTLVTAYFLLVYASAAAVPAGVLIPVTPSFLAWAYALTVTFVHVAFLGALVHRWLAVRELTDAPVTARSSR